jgi:hypothetical protein
MTSLTMTVPASVPSLIHTSNPAFLSLATKKSIVPTAVRSWGGWVSNCFTMTVPASVPSLFQS